MVIQQCMSNNIGHDKLKTKMTIHDWNYCKHSPPSVSKLCVLQSMKTDEQNCHRPVLTAEVAVQTGHPNPTTKPAKARGNRTRQTMYTFVRFPILKTVTEHRRCLHVLLSSWKKRNTSLKLLFFPARIYIPKKVRPKLKKPSPRQAPKLVVCPTRVSGRGVFLSCFCRLLR